MDDNLSMQVSKFIEDKHELDYLLEKFARQNKESSAAFRSLVKGRWSNSLPLIEETRAEIVALFEKVSND